MGESDESVGLLLSSKRHRYDTSLTSFLRGRMIETEQKIVAVDENKRYVEVHVIFLKIGEINTLKEMYEADIMVRSKWREPALDDVKDQDIEWDTLWNPKMMIQNTHGDIKESSSRLVLREDGEAYVFERRRFRGTFTEPLELWEFPFDVQDLGIAITSDFPSSEVELVETSSDVHRVYRQTFIDEQEWHLYKLVSSDRKEVAKDRADPTVKRSTLFVRACVARRPAYYVYNMFVVTLLISCLAFVTFAVLPSLTQNRLQLAFTLVLTSVAFKFVATQSLPRISYLTYLVSDMTTDLDSATLSGIWFMKNEQDSKCLAKNQNCQSNLTNRIYFILFFKDRYVIATMIMVTLITIWHGLQAAIPKKNPQDRPLADFVALAVLGSGYLIYNLQFLLRLWLVPYKCRRQVKRRESKYLKELRVRTEQRLREDPSDDEDMATTAAFLRKM